MSDCRKCAKAETCAVDEDCGLYVEKQLTNADRIRAMTDEELAKWIANDLIEPGYYKTGQCEEIWLDWLKQEAVDNGACSADETSEKVQAG